MILSFRIFSTNRSQYHPLWIEQIKRIAVKYLRKTVYVVYKVTLISPYKRKVIGRFEQVFETWIPFRKPQYPPLRFRDKVAKYWRNYWRKSSGVFPFSFRSPSVAVTKKNRRFWSKPPFEICTRHDGIFVKNRSATRTKGQTRASRSRRSNEKPQTLKDESKDDLAVPEWLSRLKRRHLWNDIPESCHFRDNCFLRDERKRTIILENCATI